MAVLKIRVNRSVITITIPDDAEVIFSHVNVATEVGEPSVGVGTNEEATEEPLEGEGEEPVAVSPPPRPAKEAPQSKVEGEGGGAESKAVSGREATNAVAPAAAAGEQGPSGKGPSELSELLGQLSQVSAPPAPAPTTQQPPPAQPQQPTQSAPPEQQPKQAQKPPKASVVDELLPAVDEALTAGAKKAVEMGYLPPQAAKKQASSSDIERAFTDLLTAGYEAG